MSVKASERSMPDIRCRLPIRETHLVRPHWTVRLLAEVYEEALVQAQAALFGVAIDLQHVGALLADLRVELVVPAREERVGHIQAFAVEADLQHLRSAVELLAFEHRRFSQDAAEPDLADHFRLRRIADVVLANVAVQPVGEIEVLVVHRQHQIGDEPRHRNVPALDVLLGRHLDDLLDLPLVAGLMPVPHDAGGGGADEAVRAGGVVVETDFEWDQAVAAEIEGLGDLAFLPVPEMELLAVLARLDVVELEAGDNRLRGGPFARPHDVVPGLIPEVVVVLHAGLVLLPRADDLELVVQEQEPAGAFALVVAEHRDHDVAVGETVDGVRRRQLRLADDLGRFNDLVHLRLARVHGIDDVDPARQDAGDDEIAPFAASLAARAGVPAEVVQLIADRSEERRVGEEG